MEGMRQPRRRRSISYSEITTALTCWAQWDFGYGGRLAGSTLVPRATAPILRAGRAWGAGMAAYHSARMDDVLAPVYAHEAIIRSLNADAVEMAEHGAPADSQHLTDEAERIGSIFDHYAERVPRLPNLSRIEGEIDVPLLGRNGRGSSSLYRYLALLDGFCVADELGQEWLVEYKFRGELTPHEVMERQRQYRWYAWGRQRESGHPVVGIIVDETLAEAPRPARIVKARNRRDLTVSHDKDQMTTPRLYREACERFGVEPHPDVIESLSARRWHQRWPIMFRPGELHEAGQELVAAAQLIRDLDAGRLFPIRNAAPRTCGGCRYRRICSNPRDDLFVDTLFDRDVPKRDRPPKEAPVAVAS